MNKIFHKPIIVFAITTSILAAIFFLFPINIFDGEVVIESGIQKFTVDQSLSLSNFIGIGIEDMEKNSIVDYYLKPQGIIIACIMIIGMPALFAYRMYLKVSRSSNED